MREREWTPRRVEVRLIEAADTLRKLPSVIPKAQLCSWPEIVRDGWDLHVNTQPLPRRSFATPKAIREMDEAFAWLRLLEGKDATIVWMRVNHKPWLVIGNAVGLHPRTARRHYKPALETLAARLNTGAFSFKNPTNSTLLLSRTIPL